MSGEQFLDGKVTLYNGDSRDVLKSIPDSSIDSVVTDPPYALVSIVKRFGGESASPAKDGDVYARASAGFMGKQWDTGETAFAVEFWAEVMRVLKPGGHVIAASGTRTYHRLAVAIEDAGFEIRDQILWLYGSGFPKSHDVSKGIAKKRDDSAEVVKVTRFLASAALAAGKSRADVDAHMGTNDMGGWWLSDIQHRCHLPTPQQWGALKAFLSAGDEMDAEVARLNARKGEHGEGWTDAEIVGQVECASPGFGEVRFDGDRTIRALKDDAAQWQGWGTALKPACEPWVLARKPLVGTVAGNVLAHGTGALNIDGCRVPMGDEKVETTNGSINEVYGDLSYNAGQSWSSHGEGRWPANVIHDGVLNEEWGRYFYSAKADAMDRIGSKHPTVKPVDLMQYLCRLITPPGGVILDPFAGSGTTGEAAWREGFQCVLIEREADYAEDVRERLRLADQGVATKKRAIAKKKHGDKPIGGLFA